MATVNYTMTRQEDDSLTITWTGLTETNSDGQPLILSRFSDKTVHVYGTFGTGGTIVIQGTNDNPGSFSNPLTLEGVNNSSLSFTAAGIETIKELPVQIRPFISAGTGVSLTCKIHVPRANKGL
jgi:hypothetical protein